MLLLVCLATIAAAEKPIKQRQDRPAKETWRVIDDAPFRVIPAIPALKPDGETLEELGFISVEEILGAIEGRTNYTSVAFSPDGRFLASGASDKTIKLWDVGTKRLLHSFKGHSNRVTSVTFSPDGRFLALGAEDKTIKLWDVGEKRLLYTFEGHTQGVSSVTFNPDGRFLAFGANKTIKLWDVGTKRLLHSFEGHTGLVYSVTFSPDGRFLALSPSDKTIKLWDVNLYS